jgi:hypothetical protein
LAVADASWLDGSSAAFRLMIATSWLAPESWRKKQEEAILEAVGANLDWMEYIRLVDRHRTPALGWAALKRVPNLKIPEYVAQQLQKGSDACRRQGLTHSMLLAVVLKGLNRAGIPAMSLKGPILSFDLYGDIGLRQSNDLDLEVLQEDIVPAVNCLEGLGWHLESEYSPPSPRQWKSFLEHERHITLLRSKGCTLEVHWRSDWDGPEKPSLRWTSSIPSVWQGCSLQKMHPIDLLLYLSNHGADHAWFRAKWLGDLARIHATGLMDWRATLEHARAAKQTRALLAGLLLLREVYGLPLPDLPEEAWREVPRSLIKASLRALRVSEEPGTGPLAIARAGLARRRRARLINPERTWRETVASLAYAPGNLFVLRLPDSLFWAYAPLSPILFAWRLAMRGKLAKRSINNPAPQSGPGAIPRPRI